MESFREGKGRGHYWGRSSAGRENIKCGRGSFYKGIWDEKRARTDKTCSPPKLATHQHKRCEECTAVFRFLCGIWVKRSLSKRQCVDI